MVAAIPDADIMHEQPVLGSLEERCESPADASTRPSLVMGWSTATLASSRNESP